MKKYEAMVLSCIDPRFQPKVYKYLKNKKLIGKYSSFTIAGAGIGVTHNKFKKWHKTFWQNFKNSLIESPTLKGSHCGSRRGYTENDPEREATNPEWPPAAR